MTTMDSLKNNLGDEKLLWSEKPRAWALFRGRNLFVFVFGIIWTIFVFGIFSHPSRNNFGNNFAGLIMVILGISLIISTFLDVFKAFFSVYGITPRRLLIFRKYPWSFEFEFESLFREDIDFVRKIKNRSGGGNIVFKTIMDGYGRRNRGRDVGFFGIDNVDSVERLVIETFRKENSSANPV
jgi:hypothetical protein